MDPPIVRRRRPSWAAFCRALRRCPGEAGSFGHLAAEGDWDLQLTAQYAIPRSSPPVRSTSKGFEDFSAAG
jgi:hypothetical protein